MKVQPIQSGSVLFGKLFDDPNHGFCIQAGRISDQLTQMRMICFLQLIFDHDKRIIVVISVRSSLTACSCRLEILGVGACKAEIGGESVWLLDDLIGLSWHGQVIPDLRGLMRILLHHATVMALA